MHPDVCITAAYGQFLPQAFLSIPRLGTLNIHPSLLPAYRGAAPVQRALEHGLTETGVTVLFSTNKMDAGPIAAQLKEPVRASDDAASLLNRLFGLGTRALIEVLRAYEQRGPDAVELRHQDESLVSFAPKINPDEGLLDPRTTTAESIVNRIRAFAVWPGVKFNLSVNGSYQLIRIWAAEIVASFATDSATHEQWVRLDGDGIFFRCGSDNSVLKVTEVQFPGKNRLSVSQLKHGLGCATLSL
jgi:methionyl-tRNA formyltransferase